MDASAARHADSESSSNGNGNGNGHTHAPDPLNRLAAELTGTDPEQPGGARLQEEAQGLLEEAWGIFTECRVMRDGLLGACQEIEQTMDDIQRRLGGLSVAIEPASAQHTANGNGGAASSNGHGASANGNDNGNGNGNGASSNGNGASSSNGDVAH
jgi:hypothetical protein